MRPFQSLTKFTKHELAMSMHEYIFARYSCLVFLLFTLVISNYCDFFASYVQTHAPLLSHSMGWLALSPAHSPICSPLQSSQSIDVQFRAVFCDQYVSCGVCVDRHWNESTKTLGCLLRRFKLKTNWSHLVADKCWSKLSE